MELMTGTRTLRTNFDEAAGKGIKAFVEKVLKARRIAEKDTETKRIIFSFEDTESLLRP